MDIAVVVMVVADMVATAADMVGDMAVAMVVGMAVAMVVVMEAAMEAVTVVAMAEVMVVATVADHIVAAMVAVAVRMVVKEWGVVHMGVAHMAADMDHTAAEGRMAGVLIQAGREDTVAAVMRLPFAVYLSIDLYIFGIFIYLSVYFFIWNECSKKIA